MDNGRTKVLAFTAVTLLGFVGAVAYWKSDELNDKWGELTGKQIIQQLQSENKGLKDENEGLKGENKDLKELKSDLITHDDSVKTFNKAIEKLDEKISTLEDENTFLRSYEEINKKLESLLETQQISTTKLLQEKNVETENLQTSMDKLLQEKKVETETLKTSINKLLQEKKDAAGNGHIWDDVPKLKLEVESLQAEIKKALDELLKINEDIEKKNEERISKFKEHQVVAIRLQNLEAEVNKKKILRDALLTEIDAYDRLVAERNEAVRQKDLELAAKQKELDSLLTKHAEKLSQMANPIRGMNHFSSFFSERLGGGKSKTRRKRRTSSRRIYY